MSPAALPRRVPNWPVHLIQWAEGLVGQPFAWGTTDCHALALAAAAVLSGAPIADVPQWCSLLEARRLLAEGWDPPTALPQLGAVPVPDGFGQPGDLVVEPPRDGWHPILVALGGGLFLTSAPDAIVHYVDRSEIAQGAVWWRWPHG